MSNKVKWMHNGFAGAPVLTNNWGSLTALLDACLVNGFNLKTVTALSRTDDTATATIGTGHGFMVDQVVLVEGCDQPSYKRVCRILCKRTIHRRRKSACP